MPQFSYPFTCRWTLWLFPCFYYCEWSCSEDSRTCFFMDICLYFLWVSTSEWNCWDLGKSMFNCIRNCPSVFQTDFNILHFYQLLQILANICYCQFFGIFSLSVLAILRSSTAQCGDVVIAPFVGNKLGAKWGFLPLLATFIHPLPWLPGTRYHWMKGRQRNLSDYSQIMPVLPWESERGGRDSSLGWPDHESLRPQICRCRAVPVHGASQLAASQNALVHWFPPSANLLLAVDIILKSNF